MSLFINVYATGYLQRLRFRLAKGDSFVRCSKLIAYSPNDRTKDIHCIFDEAVSGVQIGGAGISYLCSLYFSGGRVHNSKFFVSLRS